MILLLAGCQAAVETGPAPAAVTPRWAVVNRAAEVEISGSGLEARVEGDLDTGLLRVDASFQAWLGERPLEEVRFLEAGRLAARVPAGLMPGRYPLRVLDPLGRSGELPASDPGAFEVLGIRGVEIVPLGAVPAAVVAGSSLALEVRVRLQDGASERWVAPLYDRDVRLTADLGGLTLVGAGGNGLTHTWQAPSRVEGVAQTVHLRAVEMISGEEHSDALALEVRAGEVVDVRFDDPPPVRVQEMVTLRATLRDRHDNLVQPQSHSAVVFSDGVRVLRGTALDGAAVSVTFRAPAEVSVLRITARYQEIEGAVYVPVSAGPPVLLQICRSESDTCTDPIAAPAGSRLDLYAGAWDAAGNRYPLLPGTPISVLRQSGVVEIQPHLAYAAGRFYFAYTLPQTVEETRLTVRADALSDPDGMTDLESTVLVLSQPLAPVRLALRAEPAAPQAGDPVTLVAQAFDPFGNHVPLDPPEALELWLAAGSGRLDLAGARSAGGDLLVEYQTAPLVEEAILRGRVRGSEASDELVVASVPGPPVRLVACAGAADAGTGCASRADAVAGKPATVFARLFDRNGNLVPAAEVAAVDFRVAAGTGALEPSGWLAAGAVHRTYLTRTTVEDAEIAAARTGIAGEARVLFHGVPGPVRQVLLAAQPADPEAGSETVLVAELLDENGNRIRAGLVDLDFERREGTGVLGEAETDPAGTLRARYRSAETVERARLAAVENVTGRDYSAEVRVDSRPGPVHHLDVALAHLRPVAGEAVAVTLVARDRYGNVVAGFNAPAILSDTTGTVRSAITGTACSGDFVLGRRSELVTFTRAAPVSRLWATAAGAQCAALPGRTGQSAEFEIVPAALKCFRLDPPWAPESSDPALCREDGGPAGSGLGPQVAGAGFGVAITARDRFGNIAAYTGYALLADLTGTVATAAGRDAALLVAGRATVTLRVTRAHPADRIVADAGLQIAGATPAFPVGAGPPAAVAFASPPLSLEPDSVSEVALALLDAYGNAASAGAGGIDLALSSTSPGGAWAAAAAGPFTAALAVSVAPGTGSARSFYKDLDEGEPTLTASGPGLSPGTLRAVIWASYREARVVFAVFPSPLPAGAPGLVNVAIRTAGGNPICPARADHRVGLTTSSGRGRFATSIAFADTVTEVLIRAADCQTDLYYRDTAAGEHQLGLATAGLTGEERSITIRPLAAQRLMIEPLGDTVAGQSFAVQASALDPYDNLATDFSAAAALSMSDGISDLSPDGAVFDQGTASLQALATRARAVALLVSAPGVDPGVSNTFRILPGPLAGFAVAGVATPQRAGVDFTLSVAAIDSYQNVVTDFVGTVSLSDLSGSLTTAAGESAPFDSAPFAAGILSQAVRATRAWPDDRILVSDGVPLHAAQSGPFEVRSGPVHHFAISDPRPVQRSGQAVDPPLTLIAQDAYLNEVTDFAGPVTVSDELGGLDPAPSGPFAGGRTTVAPVFERPVACASALINDRIVAADSSGHEGRSAKFEVQPPALAALSAELMAGPTVLYEGQLVTVQLVVQNTGGLTAGGVAPSPQNPTLAATGRAGQIDPPVSGPAPPVQDIPAGATRTFAWTYRPERGETGVVSFSAQAVAASDGCGAAIASLPKTSEPALHIAPSSCMTHPVWAEAGSDLLLPACGIVSPARLGGAPAAGGGVPPYRYAWRAADGSTSGLDSASDPNPLTGFPRLDRDRAWTLTVTDARGCGAQDTVAVAFSGGLPGASFTVTSSPARTHPDLFCRGDTVGFAGSGSDPESAWDFGDGLIGAGASVNHAYGTAGIYRVVYTVRAANGCASTAERTIYVSEKGDAGGPIALGAAPSAAGADGNSEITVSAAGIATCDNVFMSNGRRVTVMAARGTISYLSDQGAAAGIQVRAGNGGAISFKVKTDRQGGVAWVYAQGTDPTRRESYGRLGVPFFGPTALPVVVEIFPSGRQPASPPRIAARFSDPMDPASIAQGFTVRGIGGAAVAGLVSYDPAANVAAFAPAAPLDVETVAYEVRLSGARTAAGGRPLDGNLDGIADGPPADDLVWTFGNLADLAAPVLSCGPVPQPRFSPDGDNGLLGTEAADTVALPWAGADPGGQSWLALRVVDVAAARVARGRLTPWVGGSGSVTWDGRDDSGLVVPNSPAGASVRVWRAELRAIDAAGNASEPCEYGLDVAAAIDAR